MKPITIRINCEKIAKEHLFSGKNGKILDLVMWPNRDGEGPYGDTHYIVQGVTKGARERGEKGLIIGNAKVPREAQEQRQQAPAPRPAAKPAPAPADDDESDNIPF